MPELGQPIARVIARSRWRRSRSWPSMIASHSVDGGVSEATRSPRTTPAASNARGPAGDDPVEVAVVESRPAVHRGFAAGLARGVEADALADPTGVDGKGRHATAVSGAAGCRPVRHRDPSDPARFGQSRTLRQAADETKLEAGRRRCANLGRRVSRSEASHEEMRTVPHGIAVTKCVSIRFSRDTAAAVGNAGVEAVATVALILWIEATCGELMAPHFDVGRGRRRDLASRSTTAVAAFAGRPVEVHARVSGVAGRQGWRSRCVWSRTGGK